MKVFLSIVCSLFFIVTQDYSVIREQYYHASKNKQNTEKFLVTINATSSNSNLFNAYKGAANCLKSRFATDKKERKDFFVKGVGLIESAVKSEGTNAEIRLIRLSIQENTPKFLKYKGNIDEDKKLILDLFDKQNAELKDYIKKYVNQSKVFTETEKKQLK